MLILVYKDWQLYDITSWSSELKTLVLVKSKIRPYRHYKCSNLILNVNKVYYQPKHHRIFRFFSKYFLKMNLQYNVCFNLNNFKISSWRYPTFWSVFHWLSFRLLSKKSDHIFFGNFIFRILVGYSKKAHLNFLKMFWRKLSKNLDFIVETFLRIWLKIFFWAEFSWIKKKNWKFGRKKISKNFLRAFQPISKHEIKFRNLFFK